MPQIAAIRSRGARRADSATQPTTMPSRYAGTTWVECRPGTPILLDPPIKMNVTAMNDHNQRVFDSEYLIEAGHTFLMRDGDINHIVQWISRSQYANVADFIEEARDCGVSAFVDQQMLERVQAGSKMFFMHTSGWIENFRDYRTAPPPGNGELNPSVYTCPAGHRVHRSGDAMCSGLYWEDITGGNDVISAGANVRSVQRTLACGKTYEGMKRPTIVRREGGRALPPAQVRALYKPAIFAAMMIQDVVYVGSTSDPGWRNVTEIVASGINTWRSAS